MIAIVMLATSGVNSMLTRPRSTEAADLHIGGSSTRRWIQSVKSAGRTPTKNTPRQPHTGITIRLTTAARP